MVNFDSSEDAAEESWIAGLAAFLREADQAEAILVDREKRRVSIATLGKVDEGKLRERMQQTLASLELHPEDFMGQKAGGVSVKNMPGQLLLEKPSCATAPRFWKWRDVAWPELNEEEEPEDWRVLAGFAAACGVAGVSGFLVSQLGIGPSWLPIALYVLAIVAGGYDAAKDVMENITKGKLDIHFLMLAVALGACFIGAWAEGALLLFLFSLSGALEHFALHRTRREIDSLFSVAPKTALVVTEAGTEEAMPVERVQPGAVVIVKPGDMFPLDGDVLSGSTAADEANLTGEANPVSKEKGDTVFSGTMNIWGAVRIKVTRPARESAFQKVIRLIQEAQHLRAPSQRLTDKFGTHYTVGILGVTAAMFFVWWLVFDVPAFHNSDESFSAFYRAMTLLVVASPCALVLSIPSAILAAIAWGAKNGILFRGGAAIEKLADIHAVAMDKTGTLTTGELMVEKIESFPEGREQEVAEMAFALEDGSTHPIARAITKYGRQQGLKLRNIAEFRSLVGQGVQGKFEESQVVMGRRELLEKGPLADWANQLPQPAPEYSEVWVIHEKLLGRILLKDQIREASARVLQELKRRGLHTIMLTGDRNETAVEVARSLGVDDVRAGLKPEDKVAAIRELIRDGKKVAMIGDGVNDAPCLAAAHVSVAMGARGSDAALEQSEVVLMNDKIENFLAAYRLSGSAKRIIRQNLILSFGTIIVMVLGATGGWVPLTVGVFAHEGSTVLVCLNSLRLLFMKQDS